MATLTKRIPNLRDELNMLLQGISSRVFVDEVSDDGADYGDGGENDAGGQIEGAFLVKQCN